MRRALALGFLAYQVLFIGAFLAGTLPQSRQLALQQFVGQLLVWSVLLLSAKQGSR